MGGALRIVLPWEFPIIILSCLILSLLTFIIAFEVPTKRSKFFTDEFMKQFEKEHEEAFPGTKPTSGGYPDAGEGRYSDKLPYKQWVEFNNAIRTHANFVEILPVAVAAFLTVGLILPKITMYTSFFYIAMRIIYWQMYTRCGSDKRHLGATLGSLALYLLILGGFGYTVYLAIAM